MASAALLPNKKAGVAAGLFVVGPLPDQRAPMVLRAILATSGIIPV